jgi:cobalt-zinc-cadmium efflux system membrane fusion protein
MKTKIHFFKIILPFTLILIGCSPKEQPKEENKKAESTELTLSIEQAQLIDLKTAPPQLRALSNIIKANGKLDVPPQQLISISVPFGGFLKSTDLLQGMRVSKGELIAVIENTEFIQMQQDYFEAKSQLDYARAEYDRQQELAKENINAQKALQQAKANYLTLLGKTNGLKAKLKLINIDATNVEKGDIQPGINIYSPINGYVTQVNANIGSFLNPHDVLFRIVDTEHLHAELTVFERDVPKLKIGQTVLFTLANENTERGATIHLIGREISADRTVQVHCHLDKEDKDLLPGMYLSAIVETGSNKVWSVSDTAIVAFEGKNFVFVETAKNTYRMVEAKTGTSEAGYTELEMLNGISASSKIVSRGAYSLLSKLKNSEEE